MKIIRTFRESAAELKSTRCLTVTGLMIAIYVALEFLTIQPSESLKINFAYLAIAVIGSLYGPFVGFFAAGICDVVGFLVKPSGAFVPIFTLIAMVEGLIYGLVAYRKLVRNTGKKQWIETSVRLVAARILDIVIVNLCLNTLAISMMYSKAFSVLFLSRLTKNVIELPIDIAAILILLPAVLKAFETVFGNQKNKQNLT
ncbi:MAG: folate family ECF transporter S component [Oscillospiraceae bacterium]|nr:folate family ECF transporter S component [Oscillospiraceae bacterium]